MLNYRLKNLDSNLKRLLRAFLVVLVLGVSAGLVLVAVTTKSSISGMQERYRGSVISEQIDGDMEIPDAYPKPLQEMLITTHGHLITFALIFLVVCLLFQGTEVSFRRKKILSIEPFVSIITTFGGLWLVRYVHPLFAYWVMLSSALLYLSFYVMVSIVWVSLRKDEVTI